MSKWEKMRPAILISLALVIPLLGSYGHAVMFGLVAVWALFGARHAIEALTLSWLLTFLNPGLYSVAPADSILRWVVLIAAFGSVMVRYLWTSSKYPKAWIWLLVFGFVTIVLSALVSYQPDVSIFKAVSLVIGGSTILLGFDQTRYRASYWRHWFITLFVVILLCSFPLAVSELGYVRNGKGFQGLLNHPQAYGVFLAPFLAFTSAGIISRRLRGWLWWLVLPIGLVSLVLTRARTGLLAFLLGTVVGFAWLVLNRPRDSAKELALFRTRSGLFLLCFLVIAVILVAPSVADDVNSFLLKSSSVETLGEAFYRSRGFLIERSLQNIKKHPWFGIGFGVASDPESFHVRREPLFGLPIGASTEKGFAFVAIVEEVGVVGTTVFLLFIVMLLRPALAKRRSWPNYALVFGALFVNFGEAVFFAMGGQGLIVWLLLGYTRIDIGDGWA